MQIFYTKILSSMEFKEKCRQRSLQSDDVMQS